MQLIILGMHRSGTSVLARVLNLMGVYFGPEGISTGANQENPKGFWERRDVRALNDSVLHGSGWDWNRVSRIDLQAVPAAVLEDFNKRASRLVLEMDGHRPWMIKEPRLCLLLPLWRQWLEVPIGIHIYRNPVEVASSLHKRNSIPMAAGLAMWERYVRFALAASGDMPRVVVSHRQLMTEPRAAAAKLLQDLQSHNVDGLRMPTARELDAFISPDLYREREGRKDLEQYLESPQTALFKQLESGKLPARKTAEGSMKELEDYESRLPPLSPPASAAAPKQTPDPMRAELAQWGDEIKAIKGLLGKHEAEVKQRDDRLVKALQDDLRRHTNSAEALLQQKVADLRMQRTALYHQLKETRREAASARQQGEEARIELATSRPKVEELRVGLAASHLQIEELREEREALRRRADELRTGLETSHRQIEEIREEREASRLRADELRVGLATSHLQLEKLREEREASYRQIEELREELAASRLQVEGVEANLAESRSEAETAHERLFVAQKQVRELELERTGMSNQLESLRGKVDVMQQREAALETRLVEGQEQARSQTRVSAELAAQLEQRLDTRFSELTQLTRLLLERESELLRSQGERLQIDVEVAYLREQLADATETVSQLVGSRSWKITRPVRHLTRLLTGRGAQAQAQAHEAEESPEAVLLSQSDLFDAAWYLRTYPDVERSGITPIEHFLHFGAKERRNPGPKFNASAYLRNNPDVAASGLNPLVHYLAHGKAEGREWK